MIAGVQSKRVLNTHEKKVVAFHEAGHALCGELLPSVDRVHRISIVPRGKALGYTLNLPAEDRYLKTREELIDYMTVLLGGRVAEQVVFGAITTGASDDLARVAEISQAMVHDYAMGTAGGGRSPDGDVQLSETTLRIRDEERHDLVEEARRAAQKLIIAHRPQLDALAHELLENEVLERASIERIMAGVPRMERAPGVGLRVVAASSAAPLRGPNGWAPRRARAEVASAQRPSGGSRRPSDQCPRAGRLRVPSLRRPRRSCSLLRHASSAVRKAALCVSMPFVSNTGPLPLVLGAGSLTPCSLMHVAKLASDLRKAGLSRRARPLPKRPPAEARPGAALLQRRLQLFAVDPVGQSPRAASEETACARRAGCRPGAGWGG